MSQLHSKSLLVRRARSGLFMAIILSGCSLFGSSTSTSTPHFQATVSVLVTQTVAGMLPSPTLAALETLAPGRTPTPRLPTGTPTKAPLTPTPTATAVCDRAAAGSPIDVTIPDDSVLRPGLVFSKTWRLHNIGSCTWTKSYAARFFYGAQMGALEQVFLTRDVPPGDSVEITVDMLSPLTPGTYQGNWKLSNASGQLFGIGPNGDSPFWVRIRVILAQTNTPTSSATASLTPTLTNTPTTTATPTPPVQSAGTLKLAIDSEVDLDSGISNPGSGADIVHRKDNSGFHNLAPLTGAVLGIFGNGEPTPANCQAASMSPAAIVLESLSPGAYLCLRSESGRLGWLRYNGLDSSNESVNLDYHIWSNP